MRHRSRPSRKEGLETGSNASEVSHEPVPPSLPGRLRGDLRALRIDRAAPRRPRRSARSPRRALASVKVVAPKDRTHEAPIRAAVEAAEAKALPRAMAAAREKATSWRASRASRSGAIVSVSDAQTLALRAVFGFYGTFGPDRFCGTVRTAVFRTDKTTGKRKRVGIRSRHTCRVPSTVTSSLTVTFAAT